ncbi:hypothetical protein KSX_35610 [Ktedonospora formicarum]|uniref:Uncharacterized protein n=1 Tax=Ktedonospora formicarum TaxID=2778364 RepID=A0A8J3I288_9CHLR|nr:hypothetical protein KSX_35610 [Ktedonospora formicarum]
MSEKANNVYLYKRIKCNSVFTFIIYYNLHNVYNRNRRFKKDVYGTFENTSSVRDMKRVERSNLQECTLHTLVRRHEQVEATKGIYSNAV